MDAMEMLLKRRSIRKFKAEQIKDSELAAVIEAARYAPSGRGAQGAFYIVVQNEEARKLITKMNAAVMSSANDPYYGAPTIILAFAEAGNRTAFEDACLGLGNMFNAAYAVGLGSCWIHRTREMFEGAEGKELLKKWGITKELIGVGSCILGYPDCEQPQPRERKPESEFAVYIR